jgi:hypothetical protein
VILLAQPAFGQNVIPNPLMDFDPSPEQMSTLQGIFDEFSVVQLKLRSKVDVKFAELKLELMKKDRLKTKTKEQASVSRVNKLVKDISLLFGESFQNNVSYYLRAKDVLTQKQCISAVGNLSNFNFQIPNDIFGQVENQLLNLDLDLSRDQVKKILKNRARMAKKEIDLDLKRRLTLIDLQTEMVKMPCDNKIVNKTVLKITELGSKQMTNRVDHFIKAKDLLNKEQKGKLFQAMLMMPVQ